MYGHGMLFMTVRGEERTWESVEKRYRILVVDDDRKLCALVRDYLAAYGMECECVYDGSTGAGQSLRRLLRRRAAGHDASRSGRAGRTEAAALQKRTCARGHHLRPDGRERQDHRTGTGLPTTMSPRPSLPGSFWPVCAQ